MAHSTWASFVVLLLVTGLQLLTVSGKSTVDVGRNSRIKDRFQPPPSVTTERPPANSPDVCIWNTEFPVENYRCDGLHDCPDFSDERDCPSVTLTTTMAPSTSQVLSPNSTSTPVVVNASETTNATISRANVTQAPGANVTAPVSPINSTQAPAVGGRRRKKPRPVITPAKEDPATLSAKEKSKAFIEGTLKLLSLGDEGIELRDDMRDLVLVVGMTGAGKSTLANFLTTDGSQMEAYKKQGQMLIRDAAGTISVNTTLRSKTIFPALMIDEETGTAFYDLPGFQDTRNASIDIVNAAFMRKVARHARRVKFVFTVVHSTLQAGENRNAFKALIQQAISFISSPKKFQDGIALIVTKIRDNETPDEDLADQIASFIEQAEVDLPHILEPHELQNSTDLLQAFLTHEGKSLSPNDQNEDEEYETETETARPNWTRIGLFRTPKTEGLLNSSEPAAMRRRLQEVVYQNTNWVESSPSDFGFPLTAESRYLINGLIDGLNSQVTETMGKIANASDSHYDDMLENLQGGGILAELTNHHRAIGFLTKALLQSQTRSDFNSLLKSTLNNLEIPEISPYITELEQKNRHFEFCQEIRNYPIRMLQAEWVRPLEKTTEALRKKIWAAVDSLNSAVLESSTAVFGSMTQLVQQQSALAVSPAQKRRFSAFLAEDYEAIDNLTRSTTQVTSLKNFTETVVNVVQRLRLVVSPDKMQKMRELGRVEAQLNETLDGLPLPFNLDRWVKPMEHWLRSVFPKMQESLSEQNRLELIAGLKSTEERIQNLTMASARAEREAEQQRAQQAALAKERTFNATMAKLLGELDELRSTKEKIQQTRFNYKQTRVIRQRYEHPLGTWGTWDMCPTDSVVTGFKLKWVPYRGSPASAGQVVAGVLTLGITSAIYAGENTFDDYGLVGIFLACSETQSGIFKKSINSSLYSDAYIDSINNVKVTPKTTGETFCLDGEYATGFSIQVQEFQGSHDDFGALSFKLRCSGNTLIPFPDIEYGSELGSWSPDAACPVNFGVCGIRTKVQWETQKVDSAGVTAVELKCCMKSSMGEISYPRFNYNQQHRIEDTFGHQLGTWGNWDMCPSNSIVTGFSIKWVPFRGSPGSAGQILGGIFSLGITSAIYAGENTFDDYGVVGIFLDCSETVNRDVIKKIHSSYYSDADIDSINNVKVTPKTTEDAVCSDGEHAVGFKLKVQEFQKSWDDFGAVSFKLLCSNGTQISDPPVTYEDTLGSWSPDVRCPRDYGVCGIQTKVHREKQKVDSAGVTGVRLQCCKTL